MTKTEVVDLEELYNFVADNYFIWNYLTIEEYIWISHIWNLKFSNDLGWWNENQSHSSWLYVQRYSWKLFYLNSFRVPNTHFKIRQNEYEGNEHALWSRVVWGAMHKATGLSFESCLLHNTRILTRKVGWLLMHDCVAALLSPSDNFFLPDLWFLDDYGK
jgi:hypothetical protein